MIAQRPLASRQLPGPRPVPLVGWRGNQHRFFHDPIAYLRAVHRLYRPVAGLVAGDPARVFAFGPHYNEALLRDTRLFHRCGFTLEGPANSALSRLGHGLVAQNGDEHRHDRRLLMPAFRRARIGGYRDDIVAITAHILDGWRIGEHRDIWRDMRGLTRRLVGAILFGLEPDEAAQLGALMARWLELNGLNRYLLWPIDRPGTPYHNLMRLSECLEQRLLAVAERRRRATELGDDALSLLVQEDAGLDRGALVGQMCMLFIAADEAAHNALTWLPFLLAQHPAVLTDLCWRWSCNATRSPWPTAPRSTDTSRSRWHPKAACPCASNGETITRGAWRCAARSARWSSLRRHRPARRRPLAPIERTTPMIAVRPRPSSELGSALPSEPGSPLRVRRVAGPAAWEACRAGQPGATVFHRWDWLATMAHALDKTFLPLGFYRGETLVGLAPLLVKQRGPFKNANWAPFPYLGPLVPAALWPRALQALDDDQRRNGVGLIRFGLAPDAAVERDASRAMLL